MAYINILDVLVSTSLPRVITLYCGCVILVNTAHTSSACLSAISLT